MKASLSWVQWERLIHEATRTEINVCFHYEFSRETPSICAGIEKFRTEVRSFFADVLGEEGLDISFNEHPILIEPEHLKFLLNYPEWPATLYFDIPAAIRKSRLKALIPAEKTDAALAKRLQSPLGIVNPALWPEVTVSIPIYNTHEQLMESFGAYLRLHFPSQGKVGKKSSRKIKIGNAQGGAAEVRRQRNALRALGVYRLRKTMSALQVLQLFDRLGQQPYSSESALNRARALAKKHLAIFAQKSAFSWEE